MSRAITLPLSWPGVLEMWLNTKNSERTRLEYTKIVEDAMTHLGDFDHITPESLARHRETLMSRLRAGKLSSSAVAVRLTALRGFLSFATTAGRAKIPHEALKVLLKSPAVNTRRPYVLLDQRELVTLVAACSNSRDKTLIYLTVETGLRCAELVKVKLGDFHTSDSGVLYLRVHGKGDKTRDIPLSRHARECLDAYLVETGRTLRTPANSKRGQVKSVLFQSRQTDGQLDTSRVRQILIAARKAAGLSKPVSPHSLRHMAAMRWLRAHDNVQAVSKLLGHSRLDTTQRYTDHLELDELAKIVEV